jgi:hypothetical protein
VRRDALLSTLLATVAVLAGVGCSKTAPRPPAKKIVVEGKVAWTDRTPAEGVTVQALRDGGESPCKTTTRADGAFELTCLDVDWIRLVAIPPGATGKMEVFFDPMKYEPRPEPWRGVELFAPRPK